MIYIELDTIKTLNDSFKNFISYSNDFLSNIGKGTSNISNISPFIKEIPIQALKKFVPDYFKVKGTIGVGRITRYPWIAIMNTRITKSTQDGVSIVFLFSKNLDRLFITLNIGTTKQDPEKIELIKHALKANLNVNFNEENNIGSACYKNATIFSAEWSFDDLNKDQKILNDYLNIYIDNEETIIKAISVNNTIQPEIPFVQESEAELESKANDNTITEDQKPYGNSDSEGKKVNNAVIDKEDTLEIECSNNSEDKQILPSPIDNYIKQFTSLHINKTACGVSPNKAILLLSILDLIEKNELLSQFIEYRDRIIKLFNKNWNYFVGSTLTHTPDPGAAFWRMQKEPFWELCFRKDYKDNPSEINNCQLKDSRKIDKFVKYAKIDQQLYKLLTDQGNKSTYYIARLRVALIKKYL